MSRLTKIKIRQRARRAQREVMHRAVDAVVAQRRSERRKQRAGA